MTIKSLKKKRSNNSKPSSINPQYKYNSMSPKFKVTNRRASLIISGLLIVIVVIILSVSLKVKGVFRSEASPLDLIYSGEVVNEYPHDPDAFTQGLLYAGNDTLFESTGLNGRSLSAREIDTLVGHVLIVKSSVRKVTLATGKVEAIRDMEYSHFGEGLTLLNNRLFQVTWLQKTGFIYDRDNLNNVKSFTNPMPDGWGLATDGKVLFGSDGSSRLYKIDPQTLKVVEKRVVRYKGHEVHNLNELEYVDGEVWANVWQTDCIVRLSAKDVKVVGWIYLPSLRQGLLAAGNRGIDVLNGIAWDQEKNRIFLTGKLWPKLYEIKVQPVMNFNQTIENLCLRMPAQF